MTGIFAWLRTHEKGLQCPEQAVVLRANETSDDDSVDLPQSGKTWARSTSIKILVADFPTLCGIKHYELEPFDGKTNGDFCIAETAFRHGGERCAAATNGHTPTAIIALQITFWFGLMAHHMVTCSDVAQVFWQSWLDKDDYFTLGVMPFELWQEAWRKHLLAWPSKGRRWVAGCPCIMRCRIRRRGNGRVPEQFHVPKESRPAWRKD